VLLALFYWNTAILYSCSCKYSVSFCNLPQPLYLSSSISSFAGACYKKSNPVDAVKAYKSAVALLTDSGRLMQAAKMSKEIAELFETEDINTSEKSSIVLSIESYEQAADLFGMEESKSQESQCRAKVAELCSAALDPPDLLRAARIYDDLGRRCLDSNLLKYNAKGYFLQSIFCHLGNNDSIAAGQAMQRYEGLDYTFGESREGKFCKQLIECVEGFDAEGFATACYEYDRISKLDPWKTSMLVKVKRTIDDDAGGEGDDDDVDLT
jgi:alpha-soluble NSF attachment protein